MSSHDPLLGTASRHEKPFFYSWVCDRHSRTHLDIRTDAKQNRRLRHLHGVSLRNLNLTTVASRSKGKTTTDDDAPYNLDTPTKRALRSDARTLTHSTSFTSLASAQKHRPDPLQKASTVFNNDGKTPLSRPTGRMRRRSTLHWSSASPRARQDKLQDLTAHRMIDTWFSIHAADVEEPIYISEAMEKCMNPSFAFFDLDALGPSVARSDSCTVRVWARAAGHPDYSVLVEMRVNLRSLQFIGKSLDNFHHPLPENSILLHLSDGIYTSFTDLPGSRSNHDAQRDAKAGFEESGSSFDALMQLANLDECIQDAVKVREQIEDDLNELLRSQRAHRKQEQILQARKDQLMTARSAIESLRKQNSHVERRIDELRQTLKVRRNAVASADQPRDVSRKVLDDRRHEIKVLKASESRVQDDCHGQLRRVGESLLMIFPIEPVKNKALHFTIRNIYLPNSTFDDTNRDEIAAALGFTAHLVHQLSLYLLRALPYPLEINSSMSWIEDPISAGLAQRRYPLHPTTVAYKFEYGVFLLNKNIEVLMSKAGLRVLDIRHTLPNLKYLLYVLTAGSGELPLRKAGGVRGLLGGRGTPSISRRTSEESAHGGRSLLRHVQGNGDIASKEKPDSPFSASPPSALARFTLRQSS